MVKFKFSIKQIPNTWLTECLEIKEPEENNTYLPSRVGIPVVHEVFPNPGVDGRQSHLIVVGPHRHTDKRGIGERRLMITTRSVILC